MGTFCEVQMQCSAEGGCPFGAAASEAIAALCIFQWLMMCDMVHSHRHGCTMQYQQHMCIFKSVCVLCHQQPLESHPQLA